MPRRKGNGGSDDENRMLAGIVMPAIADQVSRLAAEQIAAASRPKTEQEMRTAQILATLDELGGHQVGEDSIQFTGQQIILPEDMQGKMDQVVRFLEEYEEGMNTHFAMSRTFNYRPYDVAAAFDRAMKRVFGVSGVGKAQFSFFGVTPPEYISVPSGPNGATMQVPWEKITFSLLDAEFYLEKARSAEYGIVGKIRVEAPKRNRKRIEGFFKVVQEELRENSIYRGKAITAHPDQPEFLDLAGVDPEKVIYTENVEAQLRLNLWDALQFTDELRARHVPLKRAVLLHGPNGTGKTMAGGLAGLLATTARVPWTYILVRSKDDALEALNTARMYSPALVMIEDLDTMASSNQDRDQIKAVLDRLDNVQAKGAEVMVVFTSNYADQLDKNVVRPGRLDAVIEIGALDDQGYERLVKATIPPELLGDVDYEEVCKSLRYTDVHGEVQGFLPAFAVEAFRRTVRFSIAREAIGGDKEITTSDLLTAANGMADHIRLMELASHSSDARPTIDSALGDLFTRALIGTHAVFGPADENEGDIHNIFNNVAAEFEVDKK